MPDSEGSGSRRRVALVTGSSRGIGRAAAWALAADGFDICLNCSHGGGLDALSREAEQLERELGVRAIALVADVADARQVRQLVADATEELGGVDVLVNNAGITRDGLALRMSEADFDAVIDVNLKGAFNCCQAVMRQMMGRRWGRIVNMASVVGLHGNAGQANYAASKAGVIGLTKSLSRELARRGITVNAVAPGFISTDMTDALPDKAKDAIQSRIGCKRLGEPEDVAAAIGFFASERAGYITGQVLCVDGGLML